MNLWERLEEGGAGMYFLLIVSILVLGIVLDLCFFHIKLFRSLKNVSTAKTLPFSEKEWEEIYFIREREILWLGNFAAISTLLGLLVLF